jgi:16S rRNA (cytosine967-C5)-methyltransferase
VKRWYSRFGEQWTESLLDTMNRTPEFAIRIDVGKMTRDEVITRLKEKGIHATEGKFLESALYVDRIGPLLDDDLLKQHVIHVQDETSQMAALALAPAANELILDACAGQGTKTDHIREAFPHVRVVAMDVDGKRLQSVRLTRCIVKGDVLKNPFKPESFDSILLDAPCSSLGIVRKHPEIKWRRHEKDITMLGGLQLDMIRKLSVNLKRGGILVYSVCSFEPEETMEVVEQLETAKLFSRQKPLPGLFDQDHFLSLPHQSGMDGFFIARLRKL